MRPGRLVRRSRSTPPTSSPPSPPAAVDTSSPLHNLLFFCANRCERNLGMFRLICPEIRPRSPCPRGLSLPRAESRYMTANTNIRHSWRRIWVGTQGFIYTFSRKVTPRGRAERGRRELGRASRFWESDFGSSSRTDDSL